MAAKSTIIIDAGSSGTRLYQYGWTHPGDPTLPESRGLIDPGDAYYNLDKLITIKQVKKVAVDGGISTLEPGQVPAYFDNLFAAAGLPRGSRAGRKVTVMATGGMRGLEIHTHDALEEAIKAYLAESQFTDPTYETISGKQESLYGWVAANYLLQRLPRPGLGIRPGLVGYLEMGGATAQIAYIPAVSELRKLENGDRKRYAGKLLRLKIWGQEFDLYVRSFKLGGNEAWDLHQRSLALKAASGGDIRVSDPCRPRLAPKRPRMPFKRDSTAREVWAEVDELENVDIKGDCNYGLCQYLARLLLIHQYGEDQFTADIAREATTDIAGGLFAGEITERVTERTQALQAQLGTELTGLQTAEIRAEETAKAISTRMARLMTVERGTGPAANTYPLIPTPDAIPADYRNTPLDLLVSAPWNPTYGENKNRQFVGGAQFWYTTRTTFGCDPWGQPKEEPYSLGELEKEVTAKSRIPWNELVSGHNLLRADTLVPEQFEQFLMKAPFLAAWVTATLYNGFGFDPVSREISFQPFDGPTRRKNDRRPELSWTLGLAVLEAIQMTRVGDPVVRIVDYSTGSTGTFMPATCPRMKDYDVWDEWDTVEGA